MNALDHPDEALGRSQPPGQPTQQMILIGLLLMVFALYLYPIQHESLWRDEVDSIRFAQEIWQTLSGAESLTEGTHQLAQYLARPGWNGPLYFLALEPWLQIAGRGELALRFPSALAGVTAVALCYALATNLLGPKAGTLAALLMGVNPYLAWYASEGKMYTLVTALALLSTWLLLRACALDWGRVWLGYVLVTTALFYCHILTPLLLLVQIGLVALLHPRAVRSWRTWLSAGALTLPYLPLFWWQWPMITTQAETGFPFVPLGTMAQRLGEVLTRGVIGWSAPALMIAAAAGVGLGIILISRRKALGLLWWGCAPIFALYLISLRRPLFTERYLIWVLPAWLMLAAGGLTLAAQRGRAGRTLALGLAAALVGGGLLGVGLQWTTPVRADFRSAAQSVSDGYQPGELVLFQIPYLKGTFDYYAPDLVYTAAEGPYTNWGDSEEAIDAAMRQLTAGHGRVWLVLSEAPMWDSRGLTLAWFEQHGILVVRRAFNRVDVNLWQLSNE